MALEDSPATPKGQQPYNPEQSAQINPVIGEPDGHLNRGDCMENGRGWGEVVWIRRIQYRFSQDVILVLRDVTLVSQDVIFLSLDGNF